MLTGFRNCHALGVHSIALGKREGRLHRVFIAERDHSLWHNSLFGGTLSVGFHSHHCDLKIRVLAGQIGNLTLSEGSSRRLAGYRYRSALRDESPEFLYALPPAWYGVEEVFIDAGGELELSAEVFHTVWVARGEAAVWLIEEGDEDPHYLPITLSDADLNVFDWTGMYQPLSEAECDELLRRYAPELRQYAAGYFTNSTAPALECSESDRLRAQLMEAEEMLIREERAVEEVGDMAGAAIERALVLAKECEEAQREIARLRRDADAYDSRIIALLSSERSLKEEVAALRRRAIDPDGLEDIAQQARNNFTEEDLDVLDAHRAALWDAGDMRVGQPLSMVLAVSTRLIRWKGKETP